MYPKPMEMVLNSPNKEARDIRWNTYHNYSPIEEKVDNS